MPGPEIIPALRSTDHDFVAGLRFLDEYAKHLFSRTSSDLSHRFVPRFGLEEHENTYELYGELPGFDKDHITVEANDDRNIQVSGWIPRKHTDATPTVERFGEVLNPHHKVHHDAPAPVVSHSLATPNPSPAPPHEDKPETAQFGDVLNPHASFVHRAKDGKPKVRYLIAERQYGQFHRSFHFPSPIKKDEVQARLDNGILHISAPKAAVPPATKIEIKKAGGS